MATIDLMELRALVKVVQTGSFTAAALQMGTQKAYLSRVISKLERKLNARLLLRSTRALALTEVGREVYQRAIGVLAAVEDTEHAAQQFHGEPRGTLRLTCGVEFGLLAVGDWIRTYLATYPDVRVEAEYTGRIVDLIHEGYDLAIRIGTLSDSQLVARKLGELRYGLFASPDYTRRTDPVSDPGSLADHDLLVFTPGSRTVDWHLRHADGASVTIPVAAKLVLNNGLSLRDAAVAGLGITLLPLTLVRAQLAAGLLVRVLPEWDRPPSPVHAVFPSSRYLAPKVRSFVDLATQSFLAD